MRTKQEKDEIKEIKGSLDEVEIYHKKQYRDYKRL